MKEEGKNMKKKLTCKKQDAPLWFLWLDEDWETGEREVFLRDRDMGYSDYIQAQPGWPSYGILGTGDCPREDGSFDL